MYTECSNKSAERSPPCSQQIIFYPSLEVHDTVHKSPQLDCPKPFILRSFKVHLRERGRDRQTGRQTDRQTDKQTDKQTNKQTDKQIERQTDRQTGMSYLMTSIVKFNLSL